MAPAAIGSVGMGASLGGGLLSAFGQFTSGQHQQQMYDYQAQVAKINANIDQQNSEYALLQGGQQQVSYGLKAGQQFGAIRTAQGASGLDVNSGSAGDVQSSQRFLTRMDLAQIGANAGKTAYDYTVKGTMDTNQATLDTIAGKNAMTAGEIGAASSILGSVGSVSSKWMQGNTAGMWATSSSGGGTHDSGSAY